MVIKVWRNPLLKIFWLASLLYLMTKQIEDLRMLFLLGKEENQIFTSPINKTVQVLREENVFFCISTHEDSFFKNISTSVGMSKPFL